MKKTFTITAAARSDQGKGASRRLRRAEEVPGIVYGANKAPEMIAVKHPHLLRLLENESFYTQILDLEVDGHKEHVILRALQRHPFKPRILHLDLQRISATEAINMQIPLHFIGGEVAPAVKLASGVISRFISDIEVRCLPKDLPEYIEVDLSNLELNQSIYLSDLKLPANVEIVALIHGEDKPVANAYVPRAASEEEQPQIAASAVPTVGDEKKEKKEAQAEAKDEKAKAKSKDDKKGK